MKTTTPKKPSYTYDYPKADNTVDAVVFGLLEGHLYVLLIERLHEPFKGMWAVPGGFVNMDETLDAAVLRELQEETGIKLSWMEQLYTFGAPNRDPRGRVITTAYLALVRTSDFKVQGLDDAADARWFPVDNLPPLAFDHAEEIKTGLQRLRSKIRWQPVGINLLPKTFTLSELQGVYETILGRKLDKRNFRQKVLKLGVLVPAGQKRNGHRPALMYRFDTKNYKSLLEQGLDFEVR